MTKKKDVVKMSDGNAGHNMSINGLEDTTSEGPSENIDTSSLETFHIGGDGEDTEILSKGRLVILNFAWYGTMLTFLVLAIAVVPSQVQYLVGEKSKARTLAFVAATGSMVTLITAPLVGYFSDNLRSKWGRRRPFMLVGTSISSLALIGVAMSAPQFAHSARSRLLEDSQNNLTCAMLNAQKPACNAEVKSSELPTNPTVAAFFVSYALVFFGYSIMTTSYNGLIADKTHFSVRGFSSGVMGLLILFGNLSGAGLGIFAESLGVAGIYTIVGTIFFIFVMITVVLTPERRTDQTAPVQYSLKTAMLGYFQPLMAHDFRWVFITRFLMQMGIGTVLAFLEYWLDDVVALPSCMSPVRAVSIMLIPLLVVAALMSVVGGIISDRIRRRKVLVISSALIMAMCCVVLAGARVYWMAPVLAVFFGLGFGVFMSVDFAMVMDVLPSDDERAKDLAVWHQALVLPQLIATPIGGAIVNFLQRMSLGDNVRGCNHGLGYIVLFSITAVYFLLSGLLVTRIRAVA